MTPAQFKALPPLVRRVVLRELGLTDEVIDAVSVQVSRMDDCVPPRCIACLRLQSVNGKRNGELGRRWYRTSDLAQFVGPEFQVAPRLHTASRP
jgi:hypothetical protein